MRQAGRQAGREGRQGGRQGGRQAGRQAGRQKLGRQGGRQGGKEKIVVETIYSNYHLEEGLGWEGGWLLNRDDSEIS